MAKTKISEFDSNPANNTDIDGINLAEGMAPGLVNNAIRELMAQLKEFQTGSAGDSFTVGGNLTVTGTGTLSGRAIDAFPTGTRMLFQQTSAPTGWTKDTTHDNKALRVVSGTAGSGGSVNFTTAFGSQNVGSTTLSESQIPSHTHAFSGSTGDQSASHTHYFVTNGVGEHSHGVGFGAALFRQNTGGSWFDGSSGSFSYGEFGTTGGGGAHSHDGNTGAASNGHTHSFSGNTGGTGGGQGHTHSLNLSVSYVDVIICTKS